jgi:GNAT superfamily N-acetyltransferase
MPIKIREADADDDPALVEHCRAIWESYGTPPDHFRPDAEAQVLAFIRDGRAHHGLTAFMAEEGGHAVGSVGCQLYVPPYPEVILATHRLYGYVWSLFVEPSHRNRGIAKALMERAIGHLRSVGCTHVALHSSQAGRPLYERLGFGTGVEMRLVLR